jgi:hypothetical protein
VTDIQRIHPAKVAGMIATLDHLTNGRVNLGMGATNILAVPLIADEESDEILSKEIIPYFKSRGS